MVPSVVSAFETPQLAGWLVVIFWGTMIWGLVVAIGGAIAGGIAGKVGKPLQGILIGLLTAVPFVVCYSILFLHPNERTMMSILFLVLFGAVIGGSAGCVGAIVGRRVRSN
jgi:hypothetical protein